MSASREGTTSEPARLRVVLWYCLESTDRDRRRQGARARRHAEVTAPTPRPARRGSALGTAFEIALLALVLLATLAAGPLRAGDADRVATFDRAWQLVYDTHFDEAFNGVDWQAVRDELRPRAEAAASMGEIHEIIREMLSRLGQTHFALLAQGADGGTAPAAAETTLPTACRRDHYDLLITAAAHHSTQRPPADPGLTIRLLDDDLLVFRVEPESSAAEAGVQKGWELVELDGTRVEPFLDCARGADELGAAEHLLDSWLESSLGGSEGSEVGLRFERPDGSKESYHLERHRPRGESSRFGNLPPMPATFDVDWAATPSGRRVGVVRFNIWLMPAATGWDAAMPELRNGDGLVVDLRGNPGGVAGVATGVAGHLVSERISLGAMKSRHSHAELYANPRRATRSGDLVEPYAGPLAILLDGGTASTSEVFSAGMRDNGRARLFGQPTAGAALPAQMDRLPSGDVLVHATMDYIRPNGQPVEGDPIIPDELVETTREDLVRGGDPPLEAALAWIDSELAAKSNQQKRNPSP